MLSSLVFSVGVLPKWALSLSWGGYKIEVVSQKCIRKRYILRGWSHSRMGLCNIMLLI